MERTRRQVLSGIGATSVAALAGCNGILGTGSSSELSQEAKLAPDDGKEDEHFGRSVGMSDDGTTAIIGASSHENQNGNDVGAAYVYSQGDEGWQSGAKLTPEDGAEGDRFGWATAMSGDGTTAAISAKDAEQPNGRGVVYVFSQGDEGWQQQAQLYPEDSSPYRLAWAIDMSNDGTTIIIGSSGGGAYVFSKEAGSWQEKATLSPKKNDWRDFSGGPVAIADDGSTAVIGATWDNDPYGKRSGSAYVFSKTEAGWQQQAKLTANDGKKYQEFGNSVAISGDGSIATIGDSDSGGPAYVFQETEKGWQQQMKLVPDDIDENTDYGITVTMANDGSSVLTLVGNGRIQENSYLGSGYLFSKTDDGWQQQSKLVPSGGDGASFHSASIVMSADGDTVLIGIPLDAYPNGSGAGSAFIFR